MPPFKLDAVYSPTADQPNAIAKLAEGIERGARGVTLLGATGTGKTMTMAATIEAVQRPALILAHNKTLAAQLCNEFRTYFPHNAVEYFVSYYDYYQPEAYVPSRDLYIEKDSAINQALGRGTFRVRGDTLEVFPAYAETAFRASFFGDEVERLQHFDPLTGELIVDDLEHVAIWPASHYNVREGTMERAVE